MKPTIIIAFMALSAFFPAEASAQNDGWQLGVIAD